MMLLSIEIIQIKSLGLKAHLRENWNRIDISMILVNIVYFSLIIYLKREEDDDTVLIIVMSVFMIGFGFMKIMFFLRVFESFGQLV